MSFIEQYLLQLNTEKRRWRRAVVILTALSLVVALVTVWNLRMTGVTIANSASCGREEHQHTQDCLAQTAVICGYHLQEASAEATDPGATHTHTDACYSVNVVYGCGQVATPAHFHTAECYGKPEQLCTIPTDGAHAHTEGCYGRELICQQQEHTRNKDPAEMTAHTYKTSNL